MVVKLRVLDLILVIVFIFLIFIIIVEFMIFLYLKKGIFRVFLCEYGGILFINLCYSRVFNWKYLIYMFENFVDKYLCIFGIYY